MTKSIESFVKKIESFVIKVYLSTCCLYFSHIIFIYLDMKHSFYIIFTLLFSFSFSQEQIVNGIALNGPNGFVKSGNLQWTNEDNQNENLIILHMKGNLIDKNQYKSECEEGTRTTELY